MEIKGNPTSIYFYRPDVPKVDTTKIFKLTYEVQEFGESGNTLRVENENLDGFNVPFYSIETKDNTTVEMTIEKFDEMYNQVLQYLNLDFEPLTFEDKKYSLEKQEQEYLSQNITKECIHFYWVNNVQVSERSFLADIEDDIIDIMYIFFDTKYTCNDAMHKDFIKIALGAKILRLDYTNYNEKVQARKSYHASMSQYAQYR